MIGGFMLSNDSIFGYTQYKKLKVGDLVSWSELAEFNGITLIDKIKKFGVISSLFVANRGERQVALAKVISFSDQGKEKEILVISLEIVKKTRESSNV
jgi:hypothetical protein